MNRARLHAVAAVGFGLWSSTALAETIYCTPINSLPAVIATPGIHCLKKDLATAMTDGAAITINANSVTIDMNGFKLGGLGGGLDSTAVGIRAQNRLNIEIRNGTIRGFGTGIQLSANPAGGGGGHIVRDMLIDGSGMTGVMFFGVRNSVLRDSRIFDIGYPENGFQAIGVYVTDGARDTVIENNVISSVRSSASTVGVAVASAYRTRIAGNAIHNISGPGPVNGPNQSTGVSVVFGDGTLIRGNDFMNADKGTAVSAINSLKTVCVENTLNGYTVGWVNCATP